MGEEEIDTSRLTLSVQRGPPTASSSYAHLQILKDGVNIGEVLAGDRDVTVLGRNSRMSHEVLEHQSISRKHAALVHDGDGSVFAADLGSTHGTYVNGCKIPAGKATELSDGDVLKFGESTRSYVFRFSAPTAVTRGAAVPSADPTPIANEAAQRDQTASGDREHESNGFAETAPSSARATTPKPSPSLGAPTEQSGKADIGEAGGSSSEAKVAGSKAERKVPASGVETEREAMLKANLPSTFGAMRDKPLGKKAVREAHIARGVAGVAITAIGDRFATGPRAGRNKSALSSGYADEEIVDKAEARRRRDSEVAAITAELSHRDPDGADGEEGEEHEKEFIPGGWRHASSSGEGVSGRPKKDVKSNSKIRSAPNGRKEGQYSHEDREQEGDRRDEEEPMEEEEDEEEEEKMTDGMRIKLVVRRLGLPVSHEVQLSGHRKGVMALALDRAGGRVATGSNDYKVKLFDFGGMDKRHLPFREVEPEEGNVVVSISYSGTGHAFLVCTAGSQPKVYDRDGNQLIHFVKGDPYLKNMASTKGHVTRVTGGDWHPTKRNEMLTCSVDGSVRLWNLNGKKSFDNLINQSVIKLRSARSLKLGCTAAVYHQDGKLVAAGGEDGSLHLIQLDRLHAKHEVVREAHTGCVLTSISFNEDGHLVATRAMDDKVKLWDIRKLGGGVVKTFSNVPTHLETANTSFSPDGRVLVCGSNVPPKANATGVLKFFDVFTAETSPELEVNAAPDASVARVVWHPITNQVTCSTSAGGVRVMYDPAISEKGAMLSSDRSHSRLATNLFLPKHAVGEVFAPHALPMYREERNSKKRKERSDRKDPVRSKKPDPPMPGRGVQGRLSSSNTFHQYVLKEHLVSQKNLKNEDPREELLKYHEASEKEKEFLGKAYEKSQPKGAELHNRTLEQEEEDFKEEQKKLLDS